MDKPILTFGGVAPLIIQQYERYLPTAFDESMTILQKMNKIIMYLNQIGELTDQVVSQWNEVMEWVMSDGLSESVLRKLNEMIADGSLGELINEVLLNTKVDKTSLAQYGLNVQDYGVLANGTDQTTQIQTLINTHKKLYFPDGIYQFNRLQISEDDTELTFASNVTLRSPYALNSVDAGAIEIKGGGITLTQNATADIISGSHTISVNDTNGFNAGDLVLINQTDNAGTTLASHRQKYISCVLEIQTVDPTLKTLKFFTVVPHSFQTSNACKVHKIDAIKNTVIRGSSTLFDKMNTSTLENFFVVDFAKNTKISGFDCTSGGGKAIRIIQSHTYEFEDITHRKPTDTSSGNGYGIQAELGAGYGIMRNIKGYNSRHTVDFAKGAHNASVYDSTAYFSGFNGHGMNAKHILFENCVAHGGRFGVGNDTFKSDEYWKFKGCTVFNSDVGFSVSNESFEMDFEDCKVFDSLTAFLFLQNSSRIRTKNTDAFRCTNGLDLRTCDDVELEDFRVKNFTSKGILVRLGSTNVRIIKPKIVDGLDLGGVEGLQVMESSKVLIDSPYMRGEMKRGITLGNNSSDVTISRPNIEIVGASIVIDINNTNTIPDVNVVITDAVRLAILAGGFSVNSDCGGVAIMNSVLNNGVLLQPADVGYMFTNNKVSLSTQIRSTKNTLVTGNYGSPTGWVVPVHNGVDVIVANNLVTMT